MFGCEEDHGHTLVSKGQNFIIELTSRSTLTRKCLLRHHEEPKLGLFRRRLLFVCANFDISYLVVDILQVTKDNDEEGTQKCARPVKRFGFGLTLE